MPKKLTFWWPAAVGILGVVLVFAGYIAIGQLFFSQKSCYAGAFLGRKVSDGREV